MATCLAETTARSVPISHDSTAVHAPSEQRWRWLLIAALLLGAGLRLIWGEAIEYKLDEAWVYQLAVNYRTQGEWATLGMPSSQGVRVPALATWVFYPFAYIFGVDEPTGLARGVQVCSMAALVLLVVFAWRCILPGEREPWLWAAALIALNPIEVIYQRKIWPPCMLPIFCIVFLIGWWHRERRWGALAWGVLGACLGQIHSSGFLYAAAVLFATFLADRRRICWRYWFTGSVLGTLPMIPWIWYLIHNRDPVHDNFFAPHRWIEGKFWGHWVTEAMGVGLGGVFGPDYGAFLRWPLIAGHSSYGTAVLQGLAAALGAIIIIAALARWWRERGTQRKPPSSTALILRASLICYGLLLTLVAVRFYRHYLLITFPLMAVWLARLALPSGGVGRGLAFGRRLLLGLCVANALCSTITLYYLHMQGGAAPIAFGPSYEAQVHATGQRPPPFCLPPEALGGHAEVTQAGRR